ncbi:TetR/AcrR family transcriptional regulator [Pseudonocardia broussonetiae]|uniref:TetR/AcrR family transcriptional regulator n=1 Tax=Pseudonocardia broussonetiae TaxID=2736640 RepID=A0A6M6JSA7_9PSEU|nr:TetR/AcrR family transcriptional regulator [Pseudonocardia broussonetiae]QJY49907.1 TetR/AcrR family transcriptional regulator [Pseudonocardia broussonetiae]
MSRPAPARGTRPRNRRALIVAAAVELFHRVGYAGVSMSDIAAAVNVAPSALYRHFPGKTDLFVAAARAALVPTAECLAASDAWSLDELARELAAVTLDHREAGVLWQREARLLPLDLRREVRGDLREVARVLTARIARYRPDVGPEQADLLSWSALAALSSVSFHPLRPARFDAVLADVVERVIGAPVADAAGTGGPGTGAGLVPRTRRERVLREASGLFSARGFAAVTVDDIGEAVGIAGPSVYHHFPGKQDLLLAALDRGNEWLWMELDIALAAAHDEADALRRLLDSFVRLATLRHDLVDTVLGDLRQLPEADRQRALQAQHDYVTEWTELLRAVRPDLDAVAARVRVLALLMIVNDGAQTPHLARRPGFPAAIRSVAAHLLGVDPHRP